MQRQLRVVLDDAPEGQIRLIALCAGRGRDVLEVVAEHPRGRDVAARLVELDDELAKDAAAYARARDLDGVDVAVGDASHTRSYEGAVPADIVMVCGVFGNISVDDIGRTISTLPSLCAPRARVIWTRHRLAPDLTSMVRAMFLERGFFELDCAMPVDHIFCVGTQQLGRRPDPFDPELTMFTFSRADSGHA